MERHKCKDGIDKYKEYLFKDISNEDIAQAIEEGHKEAQETWYVRTAKKTQVFQNLVTAVKQMMMMMMTMTTVMMRILRHTVRWVLLRK